MIHAARHERMFPGEGGIDLVSLARAMPADITVSIEAPTAGLDDDYGLRVLGLHHALPPPGSDGWHRRWGLVDQSSRPPEIFLAVTISAVAELLD